MLEGYKCLTSAIATSKKREHCAGDIATQHIINKSNVQLLKLSDEVGAKKF
jgi:hypothetical protein